MFFFFFQAEDGIRDRLVTGVQTCALPTHGDQIMEVLAKAKRTIIVENNYSGQFARYLRSETGFAADGHIRKYDGEPFMPHHIVDGVKAQVGGETDKYIPYQEITRSEERRVGKECRSRWSPYH